MWPTPGKKGFEFLKNVFMKFSQSYFPLLYFAVNKVNIRISTSLKWHQGGRSVVFIPEVSSNVKLRPSFDIFLRSPKYFAAFLPHDAIPDGKVCSGRLAPDFRLL